MGGAVQPLGVQLCIAALLLSGGGKGRELPGSLSCLNNYVTTVRCVWAVEEPVGDGPFHLHFTNLWSKGHNASCTLSAGASLRDRPSCTVHLASKILQTDGYRVSLQGSFFGRARTYVAFPEYSPRNHIKPDPPADIQSNVTGSTCQVRWSVPRGLAGVLRYQLQYKEHSSSWQTAVTKTLPRPLPQTDIEATELRRGITYTARVRCKVSEDEDSYRSQWSEWSQTTVFQRADPPQPSGKALGSRVVQLLLVPLSFGALLYLLWSRRLSSRAKHLSCFSVPTPAAFFQPLYHVYNGNFKDWVGPNEACSHLRREEASNPNRGTADGGSDLSTQELISQISLKTAESPELSAAAEDLAFDSGPSQQYVPSRCLRAEETEERLGLLFVQHQADGTVGLKISDTIKARAESPGRGRSDLSYSQHGNGDSFVLQECVEAANVLFSSSDYCTLCDSDTAGGSIPAELLRLSNGNDLIKHQTHQSDLP